MTAVVSSPEIVLYEIVSNAGTDAGDRVYPLRIPQSPIYPLFVYSVVSDRNTPTRISGSGDAVGVVTNYTTNVSVLNRFQMQLDAYSKDYEGARLLINQVTPYLEGFSGTISVSGLPDTTVQNIYTNKITTGFETGGELNRQSLNVVMWLEQATQ